MSSIVVGKSSGVQDFINSFLATSSAAQEISHRGELLDLEKRRVNLEENRLKELIVLP